MAAAGSFAAVFASPLRRARIPAARIARTLDLPLQLDARLAERSFGTWEGRTWDSIWRETGNAMDGMVDAPDSFRPGGGETTAELAGRVVDWFRTLPSGRTAIAVCHGGPIAALAGRLRNEPVYDWLRLVPEYGHGLEIVREGNRWNIAAWPPAPTPIRSAADD